MTSTVKTDDSASLEEAEEKDEILYNEAKACEKSEAPCDEEKSSDEVEILESEDDSSTSNDMEDDNEIFVNGKNNKKPKFWLKSEISSQKSDASDSRSFNNSESEDEPELLSSDSNSDQSTGGTSLKSLKTLGITISNSQKTWKSLSSLRKRELGLNMPCLFERNISGSVNMIQKFKLERNLAHHEGCVNTLNFNETGELLASGSDDLKIILWDWFTAKKKHLYDSGHTGNVFQAKFMPNTNNNIIVSCARDGQVRVGFLSSAGISTQTKCLTQHRDGAHKLSIEPGSPNIFLSCGEDGQVIEIDLRMENDKNCRHFICRTEKNARVPLYSIFINPSKHEEFAVGGRDVKCRVYDRRQMKEDVNEKMPILKEYYPHKFETNDTAQFINITCLVYSHNGSEILVSYNDEDIYLFDANTSSNSDYIHQYKGHRNSMTVKGVNFYGPRSEFVVSGSDCGHVFLWDKTTESIVQCLEGDVAGVVNCLEPHPYFPFMATSGLDHDVKIWSPTSHEKINLDEIESIVVANDQERNLDRRGTSLPAGSDIFRFMVNQLAGRRRQGAWTADGDDEDDELSSDDEERVQCYPS